MRRLAFERRVEAREEAEAAAWFAEAAAARRSSCGIAARARVVRSAVGSGRGWTWAGGFGCAGGFGG